MTEDRSRIPPWLAYRAGVCVFVVGLATPLLIPAVLASDLGTAWKSTISGLLGFGIPEILMLAGAALMGKQGLARLKASIVRLLRRAAPPDRVSRRRYNVGLVLLGLPVLLAWIDPYAGDLLPWHAAHRVHAAVVGDVLFVAALLVLGGDFWDKLRALVVHDARVQFDGQRDAAGE